MICDNIFSSNTTTVLLNAWVHSAERSARKRMPIVRRLLNDEVKHLVRNPELRAAEALRMTVYKIRHGEVVHHPAIAEKALEIRRFCHERDHDAPVFEPARVVIPCVFPAAPFTALFGLAAAIKRSERFAVDCLPICFSLCNFLNSMLSTKAYARAKLSGRADYIRTIDGKHRIAVFLIHEVIGGGALVSPIVAELDLLVDEPVRMKLFGKVIHIGAALHDLFRIHKARALAPRKILAANLTQRVLILGQNNLLPARERTKAVAIRNDHAPRPRSI